MSYILLAGALLLAAYFARKYFQQKSAIRLLAESLPSRTPILTHSSEFRGTNENWGALIDQLNTLIEEFQALDKQSSGRLNQIQTTLGSLQEGVLIIDRDNYILLANKALQNIFPGTDTWTGQRIESVMRSSEFLQFIGEVKNDRGGLRQEMVFSKGRQSVWMEVSASLLADAEEGSAPWHLFVLHDISQLKRLETIRKQFVSNASHELKTPVSVIKGYAETLVTDHHSMSVEDRERFLATIHRHAERLALLINDLLSLSLLESSTPSLDKTEVDIFNWLRSLSLDYKTSLENQDRVIFLNVPDAPKAMVSVDLLKFRQALDNLVENANKHTQSPGTIELGAAIRNDFVEVWVLDEGPGVPEGDIHRIFERFYRVDKGRSRETGGTGLGLSIVKHILDWHDGEVWAENAEGKGLRVSLKVPVSSVAPISKSLA